MRVDLVVVWSALVALSLPALSTAVPLYVMSAPNLMRVGTPEKVFVEAQDYAGADLKVTITVMNFPKKSRELTSTSVTLTGSNKYMQLADITIPNGNEYFHEDQSMNQYVYLLAKFPSYDIERVVLVSFQSGYIFVQTDKTIYTPSSTVYYRIFSVAPSLQPVESGISVEIMTPQGITIHQEKVFPKGGIKSGDHKLPKLVNFGTWKVVTRFTGSPQRNFTAEFEVKEYVLPSFEVSLTPGKAFFHVDDSEMTINIVARYLYGKEVDGFGYVTFGVMTQNNEKTSLVASLQRVQIIHGEGKAILNRIHITQIFPNIRQLVGSTLYVSVSVLTETGSEMVEAHKKGIPIVTSPYNIHFKRTPKYFKPGMPFDLSVYVTNPDSTPANKLTVEVRSYDQTMKGSTQMDGIAKLTINPPSEASNLPLTVTTKDPTLTNDHQATRSMTAFPYETKGGPMLHISLSDKGLKSGERVNVMFNIKGSPPSQNQDFTYLILNKGQLVKAVRFKMQGQTIFTLNLEVTKEMVPSFRIVAYYHVGSLVVSDSVLAKVMDTCTDKLKLESSERVYSPRQPFSLKITGEPGARVGLVAVDKGVYVLNNKHRLTQTKIWDVIEKYDTGCTAGSGANSMGVFYDAGLIFQSNLAGGTEPRQVPTCPVPAKRRRRAITIQNLHNSLTGQYSGTDRQCCVDGMKDNIMGFSCQRRTEYISDGETCVQAFLHCCNEMSSKKAEAREETLLLARSEEDDDADMDQDIEDIISRSMFPESWLWYEEELKCPEGKEKCDTTELTKESVFKDSITSWVFTAISISKTNGICVAEPYEVVVQKKFFIDLKLPYSAVRNEQIEIKAILHNYNAFTIKVRVELLETATVCSAATKKRKYRTTIDELAPMTSWAVPYVIIPMELGKHTIEVKAVVYEHLQMDGVKKDLVVVTEGISEKSVIKILLNPAGGEQTEHVHNEIPRNQVPNTPANTYFIVSGEQLSLIIEKAIDGDSMGSLINQPSGCGEQNMIIMTLPLIATHYLDTTLQWEKVGLEKRKTAIDFIKSGYQQELAFRKQDGSFAVFSHDPSGAWLTAYVAKVFSMASEMISIEDEYICEAFNWLVQNSQQSDGIFKETFNGYHPEMVGDVRGKDANASLTAFVLIAMQEGRRLCNKTVASLPGSMEKATKYLEGRLNTLTNPYAVAMVSYALANEDKLNQEVLFKHSTGNTHWEVPGNRQFSLEATAYALLALVKAGEFDKAAPIVHWLNQQQFYGGGYGSTQSTIMVFQAVAEYTSQAKQNDHTLEIELKVSGRNKPDKWTFTKSNSFLSRSAQMEMNQNLTVKATGSGQATLSMMTLYYKMPSENQKNCTMFNLTVTLDKQNQVTYPKASESYWLTIDMLYLGDRPATMSILDIRLLTGFTVDETDLTKLSTGKERYIQKTENNNILSEKGSLILYLSQVSNKREDKIKFRLHKVMDVGLLQPGSVTLYEYLDMDKSCTRFYHPLKKDGELNRICHRDTCACAEEACCKKKSDDETSKERTAKVCEKGMDYVYKVTVENWDLTHYTDVYHLKVDQVIKEGSDYSVEGKTREFVAHPSCRESVGLKGEKDKTYLIMGHRDDVMQVEDGFKYMLGHATWLEYWPSEEESESDNYADAYEAITRMVRRFSGCKQ